MGIPAPALKGTLKNLKFPGGGTWGWEVTCQSSFDPRVLENPSGGPLERP